MPVVTGMTTTSNVAVHTISFRGLSGAVLILIAAASILYVMGFATTAWSVSGDVNTGLWETCHCGFVTSRPDWFRAVQAMITIGLIGLVISLVICCVYMCVHTVSKNTTIIALIITIFISILFMLIGFIIYGVKANNLSWSFALAVIGAILTLVAGILAIVQMRQSGVRI